MNDDLPSTSEANETIDLFGDDWTVDPATGRTSETFYYLTDRVEQIIRESASALLNGKANFVAGFLLGYLAYVYKLQPTLTLEEMKERECN